jgi:hypothetical protein
MKKLILLTAIATAFAFTSCKKDFACTCTSNTTYSNGDKDGDGPTVTTIRDTHKATAKTRCLDTETTGAAFGGSVTYTTTTDCTLAKK